MKFFKQLRKGVGKGCKLLGKHLKSELGKSAKVLGKAFREAAKDMISDAIVQLTMDLIQNLAMNYIVEPLVRKINKLCKQLGWNTRDFLAEV